MPTEICLCRLSLIASCASINAQPHDLITNLQHRVKSGDIGELVPGPLTSLRGIRIQQGGAALLQTCLDHPEKWSRDPLLYRFGHRAPLTTIGCREYGTPSMHAVFYLQPDGSREAWIHFDLHDPRDLVGHSLEVIRNRLTLGHTSQADVYRSFITHADDATVTVPPRTYDYSSHAREYYNATFGRRFLVGAMISSMASTAMDRSGQWGHGADLYTNHLSAKLARHTIQQSIEFGAAALLQQEERFVPSPDQRIRSRIKSALYRSFFVPGHNGAELAFPRIAAAFGTGFIVENWHPWIREQQNPWVVSSTILARYVAVSFWREFRPDIKTALKKKLKRD